MAPDREHAVRETRGDFAATFYNVVVTFLAYVGKLPFDFCVHFSVE